MEADTTLKEGRSINVTLKGLDKEGNVIAQETKTTTVNKNKIVKDFDIKKLKQDNNLEEDAIVKYIGAFNA